VHNCYGNERDEETNGSVHLDA